MNESLNKKSGSSIINQIDERIAARRQAAGSDLDRLPMYPHVVYPGKPDDIAYDVSLYEHLEQATARYPVIPRNVAMTDSLLDKVPILGSIWQSLRRQLHNISLFYADRALQHQVHINLNLVEAVGRLTAVTQQRQINALQQQLAQSQEKDEG